MALKKICKTKNLENGFKSYFKVRQMSLSSCSVKKNCYHFLGVIGLAAGMNEFTWVFVAACNVVKLFECVMMYFDILQINLHRWG